MMNLADVATAATAAVHITNKGKEAVQVVVRCRPLFGKELVEGRQSIVDADYEHCQCNITNPQKPEAKPKAFTFDAVYNVDSTQQLFYEESAHPLVESVMEGFNGTIFACNFECGLTKSCNIMLFYQMVKLDVGKRTQCKVRQNLQSSVVSSRVRLIIYLSTFPSLTTKVGSSFSLFRSLIMHVLSFGCRIFD
jgi:hypothetical protein